MLGGIKDLVDGGESQDSQAVGDVGTRTVTYSDGLTYSAYAFRRAATMVAPGDTLPTRNEEYGTKEYWDQRYAQ